MEKVYGRNWAQMGPPPPGNSALPDSSSNLSAFLCKSITCRRIEPSFFAKGDAKFKVSRFEFGAPLHLTGVALPPDYIKRKCRENRIESGCGDVRPIIIPLRGILCRNATAKFTISELFHSNLKKLLTIIAEMTAQADQINSKRLNLEKATNFMRQYRDPHSRELKKLSANQFMEVWSHYDKDEVDATRDLILAEIILRLKYCRGSFPTATGCATLWGRMFPCWDRELSRVTSNGYIEGTELDGFLREFVSSANATDVGPEAVSDDMLVELKACFMEAYDDNQDGKIDIRELAQLLPMEENFLLLFRFDNPLESSVEFMKIWREYDTDGSGYIEADELKNFLRDLLKEAKKINDVSEDKLIEYTDTMLQVFDSNKDGRLQLSEMAKLLPVKENFLCRQVFKGATKLTKDDIERVFALYDRDNNGTIENEELRGFLKDLLELVKKDYDAQDLLDFEETILRGVDYNQDGKINKKELTMILLAIAKHNQEEEASA
ncbi:hypothetical protein GEV33_009143 [Tenebrio molitor]|uniref:EF-hand domain-containing protein n=1 Tax=Tenebrio molitor TaxID=7067 RepID=A0A8J6HGA4_TENMO|nr:hypothetical protein GEV33_009143 [Tenebrio molitor]